MRRLRLLLAGRRRDGERGAIAVITALLVMFVAVGMLALTIDLGNITYNRAQLQNGADASSLALATACAKASASSNNCSVTSGLSDLAANNADASSGGTQSMSVRTDDTTCINGKGAAYVTAHGANTSLPVCATDPTAEDATSLSSCQSWPLSADPADVSYVEVTTQTKMKDGSDILPFDFAQLLSGGGTGTTQNTCSRAAWGPAGSTGLTFPLVIGECDWEKGSASGGDYAPAPPYAPGPSTTNPLPTVPSNVAPYVNGIFAQADEDNKCSTDPNGGFSWLQPSSTCIVTIDVDDWVTGKPGSSVPSNCSNILQNYLGKVVAVPIFDDINGTGSGAQYHVYGVAAFYLAGWANIPAISPKKTTSVYKEPDTVCTGKCNGSTTYIWGWFTSSVLPVSTTIGTGPDLGADVVAAAG